MAVSGLRFCARALSSHGKRGPLLITVCGPLTTAAPPAAEHRLQTRRPSNCGSRAFSLRGMWDPPRPGLEPMSPAPAGRPPTTAPPGKPPGSCFCIHSASLCLLVGAFNPFTFKVIIDMYVPMTIFLIVLGLFLEVLFFSCVSHLEKFL